MPRGEHFYTCRGCGKRDICGDCIPEYCPPCARQVRTNHPGENCPCAACQDKRLMRDSERIVNPEYLGLTANRLAGKLSRLQAHLTERLKQHEDNLRLWKNGVLTPTEPDEEERAATVRALESAAQECRIALALLTEKR